MAKHKLKGKPRAGSSLRESRGVVQMTVECTEEERDQITALAAAARMSRQQWILSKLLPDDNPGNLAKIIN